MCFSAQASFIAAGVLAAIAAALSRKVRTPQQWLLVGVPLFFSLQQMLEGIVWVTLNKGDSTSILHTMSVYGFLFFAVVVWPFYIPYMLFIFEEDAQRKKILRINRSIGIYVSLLLGGICLHYGVHARITDHHIMYDVIQNAGISTYVYNTYLLLYIWVTVGSMLLSTVPCMWMMGVLIGISCIIAYTLYYASFGSVWCFFAAIISCMSYYVMSVWNPSINSGQVDERKK